MSQLGFKRDGPYQPWAIEPPFDAGVLYTRSPFTVTWDTGGPDTKADHQEAVMYVGGGKPDFTVGMNYIVFFIQGDAKIYLATVDNAIAMDTLVGSGSVWGIDAWTDGVTFDNWQQY